MCERQSQNKLRPFYHFGPAGEASEIALCLGTFYHWKNTAAISSEDLKKQRDEGKKRGWGMRGFSFTADHRWCLDHLTNSYHFILSHLSSRCPSLPISPQRAADTSPLLKKKKKMKWNTITLVHPFLYIDRSIDRWIAVHTLVHSCWRHSNGINMEFIFWRVSPGGFIQFLSTAACWFNLFLRKTSQKEISAFLYLNWPSADLLLSSLLLMQIAPWKTTHFAPSLRSVFLCDTSAAAAARDIYIRL